MKFRGNFLRDWGLSFAALVGAVSGFVAFIPGISLSFLRSCAIFTTCLLISGVFAWQRTRSCQFPPEEVDPSDARVHCWLHCPASRGLVEQASALAHQAFGNIAGVPIDRYDSWRLKNPNILACLVNTDGILVGYFDILPLRSEFMDKFIRGDLTELDIRHEDILPPQHARRCKRLYLAGIAVRDPHMFAARRHARHLVWGLAKYLEHFYDVPSERQVYALGGTEEGRQLLRRFNFHMVQEASMRRDKQPLYVASLTDPETIHNLYVDFGSWAHACHLSWEEPPQVRTRSSVS